VPGTRTRGWAWITSRLRPPSTRVDLVAGNLTAAELSSEVPTTLGEQRGAVPAPADFGAARRAAPRSGPRRWNRREPSSGRRPPGRRRWRAAGVAWPSVPRSDLEWRTRPRRQIGARAKRSSPFGWGWPWDAWGSLQAGSAGGDEERREGSSTRLASARVRRSRLRPEPRARPTCDLREREPGGRRRPSTGARTLAVPESPSPRSWSARCTTLCGPSPGARAPCSRSPQRAGSPGRSAAETDPCGTQCSRASLKVPPPSVRRTPRRTPRYSCSEWTRRARSRRCGRRFAPIGSAQRHGVRPRQAPGQPRRRRPVERADRPPSPPLLASAACSGEGNHPGSCEHGPRGLGQQPRSASLQRLRIGHPHPPGCRRANDRSRRLTLRPSDGDDRPAGVGLAGEILAGEGGVALSDDCAFKENVRRLAETTERARHEGCPAAVGSPACGTS
jgi:hypothetical protein